MNYIASYLTLRTLIIFCSTALSIGFIMLALNIITVDEAIALLGLSPEAASAFRAIIFRVQEISGNILDIISQLLNKLLGWAGVKVDLNQIHVNTHPNIADPQVTKEAVDAATIKDSNSPSQ